MSNAGSKISTPFWQGLALGGLSVGALWVITKALRRRNRGNTAGSDAHDARSYGGWLQSSCSGALSPENEHTVLTRPARAAGVACPIRPFSLERYFALHEFNVPDGLLCCSDVESGTFTGLSIIHVLWRSDTDVNTCDVMPSVGVGELLQELKQDESKQSVQLQDLWANLHLGYTESQGLPLLRQLISTLYTNITKDQLLVCTPQEGIFLMSSCILDVRKCIAAEFAYLS